MKANIYLFLLGVIHWLNSMFQLNSIQFDSSVQFDDSTQFDDSVQCVDSIEFNSIQSVAQKSCMPQPFSQSFGAHTSMYIDN